MNHRQFGFLVGFLSIWAAWAIGFWEALLALLVGLVGYVIVRAIGGDLDFSDVAERVSAVTRR